MHGHRSAVPAAHLLGEANVIRVPVGQDDRLDVFDSVTHRSQLAGKIGVIRRQAGVDDRDRSALLDEIARDAVIAQSVQGWSELHVIPR